MMMMMIIIIIIIIKLIFKKRDGEVWNGLVWLRIGTGCGSL